MGLYGEEVTVVLVVLLLPMSPPPVATVNRMPELLASLEMVATSPWYCWLASSVADVVEPKETEIGSRVTIAVVPLLVGSFTLVAVMVADVAEPTTAGAVYRPLELIVPAPEDGLTLQVTPEFVPS